MPPATVSPALANEYEDKCVIYQKLKFDWLSCVLALSPQSVSTLEAESKAASSILVLTRTVAKVGEGDGTS